MNEALQRSEPESWLTIPERGSALGITMFVWAVGIGGRKLARALLWLVMPYYFLSSARARRASREFRQTLGEDAPEQGTFAHLMHFGRVAVDRLLLVQGKTGDLDVDLGPVELLDEL
ncbi:MAG: hypothetical protein KUG77_29475, partial [Nannocystaceae bacterium]|nr:hypothetical protein [Nannocystaceae bacterium]